MTIPIRIRRTAGAASDSPSQRQRDGQLQGRRADLESRAAIMVADIESEWVLADGRWLFAQHLVKPLFVEEERRSRAGTTT